MQLGLSPKLVPALAGILVGVLVALLVDHRAGLTIIGTAGTALGAGYALPPGEVAYPDHRPGPASDELLGDPSPPRTPDEPPHFPAPGR